MSGDRQSVALGLLFFALNAFERERLLSFVLLILVAALFHGSNLAQVTISNDNVFGDNTSAQITQMTPSMSGSVSAGYTASATIGLAI